MLRYKTETRPGLVALYDIGPGNGAGQFLQPRSPHGAAEVAAAANPKESHLHMVSQPSPSCSVADSQPWVRIVCTLLA